MDSPPTLNCLQFPQCQSIELNPLQGGGRSGKMTRTSTSPRRSFLHKTFSATIQLPPTSCNSRPFQITLVSARDSTTHIPHRSPVYRLDVGERHGLCAIVVPSLGFWSTDPSAERTSLVQINGRGGKKMDHTQGTRKMPTSRRQKPCLLRISLHPMCTTQLNLQSPRRPPLYLRYGQLAAGFRTRL